MSRIGKSPIPLPAGVSVSISPGRVMVNGPLGELSQRFRSGSTVEQGDGELVVTRPTERGEDRALHGLTRTLVANMVEGVTKGFEKTLEIQGVGYRAVHARNRPGAQRRLLPPRREEAAAGDHVRGARSRRRSSSRASTSSRSARSPPRSAPSARPSRTRARASATRASTSAARSGSERNGDR